MLLLEFVALQEHLEDAFIKSDGPQKNSTDIVMESDTRYRDTLSFFFCPLVIKSHHHINSYYSW